MKSIAVFLILFFISNLALACRGYELETRTFLTDLPATAMEMPVVAKIKILSFETRSDQTQITRAKVISSKKGTESDTILLIETDPLSSCDRDPSLEPGQEYFVAGSIAKNGRFQGAWKQKDLERKK